MIPSVPMASIPPFVKTIHAKAAYKIGVITRSEVKRKSAEKIVFKIFIVSSFTSTDSYSRLL